MSATRSDRGFTLIELLVCIAILAVMSLAILNMLLMSATVMESNALSSHAVALAVQEKEDVRSIDYTVVAAMTARDPYTTASPDRFPAPNGIAFTVHSDISANTPIANVCTITTTVSWSHKGTQRTYVLRSLYAAVNS